MTTRTNRLGLALGVAALLFAVPAAAAPARDGADIDHRAATNPRRALDADLPTDRPIIATVVKIDGEAGTVMLETPHGQVALSVSPELAERLTVGDVVVVKFTDEDDFPAASPRGEDPADERPNPERPRI